MDKYVIWSVKKWGIDAKSYLIDNKQQFVLCYKKREDEEDRKNGGLSEEEDKSRQYDGVEISYSFFNEFSNSKRRDSIENHFINYGGRFIISESLRREILVFDKKENIKRALQDFEKNI